MAAERTLSVLYVGTLPPHNGGSAISAAGLLVGLAGRGHRVRAIAPMTAEALGKGDRFAEAHPQLGVRRYEVPYFETSPHETTPAAYRRLERTGIGPLFDELVAEQRPDAVIAGRESFARVVPELAEAHRLTWALRLAGATAGALAAGTYDPALAEALVEGFRRADVRFAPAAHLARRAHSLGIGEVSVIPNAVDLERFRPRPRDRELAATLGIGADDVVVAHVSNLKAMKRPLEVVASAARALRDEPRLRYLVVGDGQCRPQMAAACAEAGIADRFTFTGWVDYERVPRYLSVADVAVLPSTFEGQARVYLETQACGRVLLASDIDAAREVVADGETGVLFRLGDVDDLAARTVALARDPDLRERIGRQARVAVQAHSLPAAARRLETLLRSLANGNGGA